MAIRLGVVMDPIQSINIKKDSTFAMLLEASNRQCEIHYIELNDLFFEDGIPYARTRLLTVKDDPNDWYQCHGEKQVNVGELDVILMRKDPPFNDQYIYATYLLECAERLGALVVNRPQALRDLNEKFALSLFPQCAPHTLVTQSISKLQAFWQSHGDIVCKPLDGMGGVSIYRLMPGEVNANVIFDALTKSGTAYCMAQRFIPEIVKGDRRIIIVDGKVIPHALVRIPQGNDWRGNLAVGAKGVVEPLTEKDAWIASQVAPVLKERGILFAGIDVIGDYLTEINITSPTGIREIDRATGSNISGLLFDAISFALK